MFFELRTYDLKPGKAPVYLDFFRTFGVSRVTRHLPMIGYWQVESGRLNRIEHLWAYDSFEERDACRAGLLSETEWMVDFVPKAFADVVAQESRILRLDEGSDTLSRVVERRKTAHPDQTSDAPMFARGLHALSLGENIHEAGECLGAFTVLSGPAPGTRVTLATGSFERLCTPAPGIVSHEFLRPLHLSPLQ